MFKKRQTRNSSLVRESLNPVEQVDKTKGVSTPVIKKTLRTKLVGSNRRLDTKETNTEPKNTQPSEPSQPPEPRKPSEPSESLDPLNKANQLRASLAVDYDRSVCKDYKQSGYCGYGDSCKFLHIREDFDLPKPVKAEPKAPEEIKNECVVCKKLPEDAVSPQCSHLYCEECYLSHTRTINECLVCNLPLDGARPVPR